MNLTELSNSADHLPSAKSFGACVFVAQTDQQGK